MKIWDDLTKNPATGRHSQKRIGTLVFLFLAVFLILSAVVELHLHGWHDWSFSVREPNTELIIVVITAAMGTEGLKLAGHYFNRKTADGNGQPLKPAFENTETETNTENENE